METIDLLKEVLSGVEKSLSADSVIGAPISNGTLTVIPINKMSIGFGSGGGEIESKNAMKRKDYPLGAVGGGASILPLGFLILDGFEVRFIRTEGGDKWNEYVENIINLFGKKS